MPEPTAEGAPAAPDGVGRVRLRFRPADAEFRVPPGVTVFDAASWNGIAVDSTCGGHGTCKKCKVRILDGSVPISKLDVRAFSGDELRVGVAARLPGAGQRRPRDRGPAADDPAQGGHGRRRAAGDPAPGRAEALRRAHRADAARPGHRRRAAARRHRRPRAARRPRCGAHARADAACQRLQGHRRGRRRRADRRRARQTPPRPAHGIAFDLGHHHRRRDPARPVHRHAGRRPLDAEQAAAVRGRRHHPDQRDDARPGRARTGCATSRTPPSTSSPARSARAPGSTPRRSTRSRSPATRR